MRVKKLIVSILGIRPDLIRCSEIIRRFDEEFDHILIWTGQHFDQLLSDVFFQDLKIRRPDYDLNMGKEFTTHHSLSGMIGSKVIELLEKEKIKPDAFFFLGDSNSVAAAMPLKKEYGDTVKNIHCEAGMRSGDKRMLEEINRIVCDHCSDLHFVYHEDYKTNLLRENLPHNNIYVVGNTIVEVCNKFKVNIFSSASKPKFILMDIHRPENFKYLKRLENIMYYAHLFASYYNVFVKIVKFPRTMIELRKCAYKEQFIEFVDLMSYKDFLRAQKECLFMLSDSGTAQEEPALLGVPVIVPRDYTERPQSVVNDCSLMLDVNEVTSFEFKRAISWLEKPPKMNISWLGDGHTAEKIINVLKDRL